MVDWYGGLGMMLITMNSNLSVCVSKWHEYLNYIASNRRLSDAYGQISIALIGWTLISWTLFRYSGLSKKILNIIMFSSKSLIIFFCKKSILQKKNKFPLKSRIQVFIKITKLKNFVKILKLNLFSSIQNHVFYQNNKSFCC